MIKCIKKLWSKFEAWVHSWFPGFKTRFMAGLGALSMAAATLQQYVTGLPSTKWLSQEFLTGASAILFTLSFWFSNMGERVKARKN